jgi:predicted O-methyltransferase YrrM
METTIKANSVLQRILETGQFEGPDGQLLQVRAQIDREEGEFLQKIIADINPKSTLEVGFAYGVSAMFICDALERTSSTRHIVIDSHQLTDVWDRGAGLHNLKKAGYEDIIELHNMESQHALPQLEASGLKIDFAFIDGAHTFDHTLVDFFYIDRMLRIGGVVAFDDVQFPSVRRVCRFVLKNRNYSVYAGMESRVPRKTTLKRQILNGPLQLLARSKRVRRLFAPDIIESDSTLGITSGRCLALKKEDEDTRGYEFHQLGHKDF